MSRSDRFSVLLSMRPSQPSWISDVNVFEPMQKQSSIGSTPAKNLQPSLNNQQLSFKSPLREANSVWFFASRFGILQFFQSYSKHFISKASSSALQSLNTESLKFQAVRTFCLSPSILISRGRRFIFEITSVSYTVLVRTMLFTTFVKGTSIIEQSLGFSSGSIYYDNFFAFGFFSV